MQNEVIVVANKNLLSLLIYMYLWRKLRKIKIIAISVIIIIIVINGYSLGTCNCNVTNERQAVDEVRHLMPPALNGLTVGEMLDSISHSRYWWTHVAIEERFLFPNRHTTWVHFQGQTNRGYLRTSISIDRGKKRVYYTFYVDGRPVFLENLYAMFR